MLDGDALRKITLEEKPDFIVPEIEAIATQTLLDLEDEGFHVVPSAKAAHLTMNREGIRRLAAEELGLKTSAYQFAETKEEYLEAVNKIGIPCTGSVITYSHAKASVFHKIYTIRRPTSIDACHNGQFI